MSRTSRRPALLVACLAASAPLLAGCLNGSGESVEADPDALAQMAGILAAAKDCELAVGLSVMPGWWSEGMAAGLGMFGEKVGPFYPADAREDIGPYSYGGGFFPLVPEPVPGVGDRPMTGFWHTIFLCDSYAGLSGEQGAERFAWGLVLVKIQRPAFDTGGADSHYMVSAHSFSDLPLVDAARAAFPAIYVSPNLERSVIEMNYEAAGGPLALHGINDDLENGHFEWNTWHVPFPEPLPSQTIRIWQLVPVSGIRANYDFGELHEQFKTGVDRNDDQGLGEFPGEFYPVTWDLEIQPHTEGAKQYYTLCPCGTFQHTEAHAHDGEGEEEPEPAEESESPVEAPDVPLGPPLYENGMYWTDFDMELRLGPDYDVVLPVTWIH